MSYAELALTDVCIVALAAILEIRYFRKQELRETILYERIDLIRPERHAELVADLQEKTGITFSHLELGKINFMTDTVLIEAYYYPHEQVVHNEEVIEVTMVSREY